MSHWGREPSHAPPGSRRSLRRDGVGGGRSRRAPFGAPEPGGWPVWRAAGCACTPTRLPTSAEVKCKGSRRSLPCSARTLIEAGLNRYLNSDARLALAALADPPEHEAWRRSDIVSVQSTPLVARSGQVVGMMSTHCARPHQASDGDYRFFDILARLAADFIERARAEVALRERSVSSSSPPPRRPDSGSAMRRPWRWSSRAPPSPRSMGSTPEHCWAR